MLMPKLSKRERTILILCCCVIIFTVLYNFILEPFVKRWMKLNSKIEIMRLKLRKSNEILKRRMEIMEQYENVASFVSPQTGSDEEEIASLLTELERLASLSNARITDIKPRAVKKLGYYKRYKVDVESEADISRLTKFIYEIQNSPQVLNIERLSINMKGGTGNLLKARMVVTKILP